MVGSRPKFKVPEFRGMVSGMVSGRVARSLDKWGPPGEGSLTLRVWVFTWEDLESPGEEWVEEDGPRLGKPAQSPELGVMHTPEPPSSFFI